MRSTHVSECKLQGLRFDHVETVRAAHLSTTSTVTLNRLNPGGRMFSTRT